MSDEFLERISRTWSTTRDRFSAYELLRPGDPSFVCQADKCVAHCCKVFSVALNDEERVRMERTSGLQPIHFLEMEGGEPVTLPLADPYLLGRKDGHCILLRDDLLCGQYEGRPDACRLYPHQLVFIDDARQRPSPPDIERFRESLTGKANGITPLLLRHLECPGFTGEAHTDASWRALSVETYALQFHDRRPLPG